MTIDPRFESILQASDSSSVVLAPPGNSYEVHLEVESPLTGAGLGDRISGTAHAHALRVHRATGGGAFIEPVVGQPRIVAGRVLSNDGAGTVLVRSAIPILVNVDDEADRAACVPGEFVNFHVESGARFQQASS
ncbi:MAG: hypothetical protein MK116_07590 [Phycisphaerales bacterium]|nr:hypothetical protein [Phycisphaerales bacterium]